MSDRKYLSFGTFKSVHVVFKFERNRFRKVRNRVKVFWKTELSGLGFDNSDLDKYGR
jgi:hypothetical protein